MTRQTRSGFTLVELLIVIVILGIIAAVVVPAFSTAGEDSAKTAFVADLRQFNQAAQLFHAETGEWLEDSATGEVPAGFEEYIDVEAWTRPTPIGGLWDCELNEWGVHSALGVHMGHAGSGTRSAAFMMEIDGMFDDGLLGTGGFRELAPDRYYQIIDP